MKSCLRSSTFRRCILTAFCNERSGVLPPLVERRWTAKSGRTPYAIRTDPENRSVHSRAHGERSSDLCSRCSGARKRHRRTATSVRGDRYGSYACAPALAIWRRLVFCSVSTLFLWCFRLANLTSCAREDAVERLRYQHSTMLPRLSYSTNLWSTQRRLTPSLTPVEDATRLDRLSKRDPLPRGSGLRPSVSAPRMHTLSDQTNSVLDAVQGRCCKMTVV